MSKPFFIWTMRRTGGTSLTDLLMEMSEYKKIEHEPFNHDRQLGYISKAFQHGTNIEAIKLLKEAFQSKPLIKHCYEIHNEHLNKALATLLQDQDYRHIFLLRKDESSRILSLLLAYQTDVWGKHGSEKVYNTILSGQRKLEPFDLNQARREVEIASAQTRRVKKLLDEHSIPYFNVYFEEIYTGEKQERLDKLNALFAYLEFDAKTIQSHQKMIDHIVFNKSQKSHSVLQYVPNYKEVQEMLNDLIGKP